MVLPFPLPFPFPLPQWQMPPVAAFVFLDFAFPFPVPFAFAFAEEVFIEVRLLFCSAMSAVALIAVLCLRLFFGGSIGEEGCRSIISLNTAGSPSWFNSMKSVGGWYRTAGSGTNVSVAAPGGNDGKPWRVPFSPDSSSNFSVVGSMLPLALVGCGSIFMGEISIFMNGAGRLRLGVQASEKDLPLLVSLSQWVESEGRPL